MIQTCKCLLPLLFIPSFNHHHYLFLHLSYLLNKFAKKKCKEEKKCSFFGILNGILNDIHSYFPRICVINPHRKFKFLLLKTEIEFTIKRKSWFEVYRFPPYMDLFQRLNWIRQTKRKVVICSFVLHICLK